MQNVGRHAFKLAVSVPEVTGSLPTVQVAGSCSEFKQTLKCFPTCSKNLVFASSDPVAI